MSTLQHAGFCVMCFFIIFYKPLISVSYSHISTLILLSMEYHQVAWATQLLVVNGLGVRYFYLSQADEVFPAYVRYGYKKV